MNLKNKKVLVTGGAGFVGSHLTERLVELGAKVVVVDNFITGKEQNLANVIDDIELHNGDISEYETCEKVTKNCDFVFNLAYPYGVDGLGLHQAYIDTGVQGTFNLLKASTINHVKRLVNASSVSAYGIVTEPNGDRLKKRISEEMVGKHFLHYGITKLAGENYCKVFPTSFGLETTNLRYFYVYGPRYATFDHSALIKFLTRCKDGKNLKLFGDGLQLRDYTYISDVVEGTIQSLNGRGNGEVYNLSGGGESNIVDLAKLVIKTTNSDVDIERITERDLVFDDEWVKIPFRGGVTKLTDEGWVDERNYVADISKAKEHFGYEPKVSLENGIEKMWKWLKK
tara:strand:+ start:1939 stop:2961 length:1023 start_codon:yes stop_codon:yes gene_type:complete